MGRFAQRRRRDNRSCTSRYGRVLVSSITSIAERWIGWVKTEIGLPLTEWMETYATHLPAITAEAAGSNVIAVSEKVTLETTASFWSYDGSNLAW